MSIDLILAWKSKNTVGKTHNNSNKNMNQVFFVDLDRGTVTHSSPAFGFEKNPEFPPLPEKPCSKLEAKLKEVSFSDLLLFKNYLFCFFVFVVLWLLLFVVGYVVFL